MSIEDLAEEKPLDGFTYVEGWVYYKEERIAYGKATYLYFKILEYFGFDEFSYNDLRTKLYYDSSAYFHHSNPVSTAVHRSLLHVGVLEEVGRDEYRVVREFSDPNKLNNFLVAERKRRNMEGVKRRRKFIRELNIRESYKRVP